MGNSVASILKEAKSALRNAGISSWGLDADLLMALATGLTREQLTTHNQYLLNHEQIMCFNKSLARRLNMEPIQYITGKSEFMDISLYVDKNVLIPRPDTECITELAIKYINESGANSVLDLCCGSGAIGLSIAKYCPNAFITAADISREALIVAKKNAVTNGLENKISFIESDMFESLNERFDVIISNPPYITQSEMGELSKAIIDYEPKKALFGGEDGLSFYRLIGKSIHKYLNGQSRIFLEMGWKQKKEVSEIFQNAGYFVIDEIKDLAGLDRGLILGKNKKVE